MLVDEKCLPLREAAEELSKRIGRRIDHSTLWRWARRGVRGVHLESRRFGRRFFTSIEALDRFGAKLAELAEHSDSSRIPAPDRRTRSSTRRTRQIESAKQLLDRAGI